VAVVLTVIFAFFAIFQPGVLIPALAPFRLLLGTALLALIAWIASPMPTDPLKPKPILTYFIIGFVSAQILSVAQFFYIPMLIEMLIKWGTFALAYMLISNQITSSGKMKALWAAVGIAAAWLAIQAAWIYHTQDLNHPQMYGGRLSSYGAYSGANDMALLLVITWPIIFKFLDLNRNLFLKLLIVPVLLTMIYVDLRTLSRAGLLGLSMVMGLSMLRGRSLGKMGRWALLVPAVIVVFIVGSKLLLTRADAQDFSGQDESVQHRYDAWYAGMQMLKSSPIIGVGSGNFVSLSDDFGAGRSIQAHNTIVKVAAETGLFGLVCYLGIVLTSFQLLYRNWRRFSKIKPDGPEVLWCEALGLALLGFFFNTQFSVKAHEWLLYMVAASAMAIDRLYPKQALIYALKIEKAVELLSSLSDEKSGSGEEPDALPPLPSPALSRGPNTESI
jgi:O-antigen ligase